MLTRNFFHLLVICALVLPGRSFSDEKRRSRILGIIEEELGEVTRLSRVAGNRDPELLMRAAELNLEKARLQREAEHERFLALSPEQRRGADQARAYASSTRSFQTANQYAQAVVKNFPKYRNLAEVYYVLAYNARELKQYDQSKRYFDLATKNARAGTGTFYKSQLALADAHYNKQEYSKAIPLYESALAKLNEAWWTKDAFNLAWCYYRVKSYDKSIALMKQIHKRSGDQKYIDMKHYVERDLGLIYVDARKTSEGLAWYREQGIDFSGHLIKLAKVLIPQGKFTQAEQLAEEAEKMQKTPAGKAEVLLLQLDLYDKFEKVPQHLKASAGLTEMAEQKQLSEEQQKLLVYQISKKAAELQKSAASDTYKTVRATREARTEQANSYFTLLARLKPGQTAEPLFFKGETSYAAGQYIAALESYQAAYVAAQRENNGKITSQAMEGMLAALGQKELPAAQAEKYYVPVYTAFLKEEPTSARAKVIRQKLYKIHMDRKDIPAAEAVLRDYAQRYPEDFKTQEAMLAGVMEDARQKKDYDRVKGFVSEINAGTYKVSEKYADALRQFMTKIQIEGAQSSLDKGDKANALKAYIRIYHNPESTPRAKANAAYNIAALYYEANDLPKSYEWSVTALKEMDVKEVRQFTTSFLTISTNLFLRQRFQQSADLSLRVVAKLCAEGVAAKNTAFKNSAFLWLAENQLAKAEEVLGLGERCAIDESTLNEVRLELAKEYVKAKRWESLLAVLQPVRQSKSQGPLAIVHLEALRQFYIAGGNSGEAQKLGQDIIGLYRSAKAKNLEVPAEALDLIAAGIMPKLEAKRAQLKATPLEFPEQKFNALIKQKLAVLDSLTADVNEVQSTGSGSGIVRAYKILINAYEDFAEELRLFTPPEKSEDYLTSFRKAMAGVWTPILQTAQRRRSEVRDLSRKNEILSDDNFELFAAQGDALVPRYNRSPRLVLMDRGGQR
mgnify:CR=1 FL=1